MLIGAVPLEVVGDDAFPHSQRVLEGDSQHRLRVPDPELAAELQALLHDLHQQIHQGLPLRAIELRVVQDEKPLLSPEVQLLQAPDLPGHAAVQQLGPIPRLRAAGHQHPELEKEDVIDDAHQEQAHAVAGRHTCPDGDCQAHRIADKCWDGRGLRVPGRHDGDEDQGGVQRGGSLSQDHVVGAHPGSHIQLQQQIDSGEHEAQHHL
mmetsp:Transcript_133813/g.317132  ORF Transcript_133813/g.317132 Transcript_133813/m.317132 type:complete len:207 (-) Transcript_133813:3274-3894(-)